MTNTELNTTSSEDSERSIRHAHQDNIALTGDDLTIDQVCAVARQRIRVDLSPEARNKVIRARQAIQKAMDNNKVVYAVTTGVGKLCDEIISPEDTIALQRNIVFSHAVGVGNPLPEEVVRAGILIKINAMAKGYSGISLETLEAYMAMLNNDVYPFVPEKGSLGASGDLAQLAHIALVLIGSGEAFVYDKTTRQNVRVSGSDALARVGLKPIQLGVKEGISLTNGTEIMTAIGALAVRDASDIIKTGQISAAMSFEALKSIMAPLDPRVSAIRPQQGQGRVATNMRRLLEKSKIVIPNVSLDTIHSPTKQHHEINYGYARFSLLQIQDLIRAVNRLEHDMNDVNTEGDVDPNGENSGVAINEDILHELSGMRKTIGAITSRIRGLPSCTGPDRAEKDMDRVKNQLRTLAFNCQQNEYLNTNHNIDEILSLMNRLLLTVEKIQGRPRIQDAYSLRCSPQVIGAAHDALDYARKVIQIEINSCTDNPVVFPDSGAYISAGNFHGQPVALAMDTLAAAAAEIGSIAERRIARMIDYELSNGLPPFLVQKSGLNTGFMMPQYTAASLSIENRIMATPAAVQSLPSSANQEDHVSMGTVAALKCRQIVENTIHILAVEFLSAAQGIDFRNPLNTFSNEKESYIPATDPANPRRPGKGTAAAYDVLRKEVSRMDEDRIMYLDIHRVSQLIRNHAILNRVERVIGRME